MPLKYIEGDCDQCEIEIGNDEAIAVTTDAKIICKDCGEANPDKVFKWIDSHLAVEEEPEEPEGDDPE